MVEQLSLLTIATKKLQYKYIADTMQEADHTFAKEITTKHTLW